MIKIVVEIANHWRADRTLWDYILGEVCRKIAHWIKHTPNDVVPISVNLSRVDFSDAQLFEKITYCRQSQ